MRHQMTWIKLPDSPESHPETEGALCKGSTCIVMPYAAAEQVSKRQFEEELVRLENELMDR